MRVLLPIVFVLTFFRYSYGQDSLPIMGDISEIAGLKKVYVIVSNTDDRNLIFNQFRKDKTFTVVGDPAGAEFFMSFVELSRITAGRGQYQERDEAEVYYYDSDRRKIIVWSDTETIDVINGMWFSRPNEVNLVRNFLKAYKIAVKPPP